MAVRSVEVQVSGTLDLRYTVEGDLSRICIPPLAPPHRTDELWKHTCFEVFLSNTGDTYREFNFSPSTEWAGYDFTGYRTGMAPIDKEWAPGVRIHRNDERFELEATLRTALPLRLALAAVIEEEDGRLSYWALKHPSGQPDFHHTESFALNL